MNFILAQIFGFIASILAISASQTKKKSNFLILYIFCYAFFILNFTLLKAYSGIVNNLVLFVLTIISKKYENKKIPKILIIFFFLLILITNIVFFQNIYSLFPFIASIFYVLALISKDMNIIRKETLIQKIMWTIYDFLVQSYATFIMDIISAISIIIAMFRYDKKCKNIS